jgi:hypothetical protein
MYGRVSTPLEIMDGFSRDLKRSSSATRSDLLRDALDDARAELQSLAVPLDAPKLAGGEELIRKAAFAGAELLMAVGLPLLKADDRDGFDRWLEMLVAMLHPTAEAGRSTSATTAAAVLAFHGAAVPALYTERFELLRVMLDRYLEHRYRLVHVAMLDDHASRAWGWLAGSLPESRVLAQFESKVIPQLETALSDVFGLAVLQFIVRMDLQEAARVLPVDGDLHNLNFWPGLTPQGCAWVESLPESFMAAPSRERAIAEKIFGAKAEAVKSRCKLLTLNIAHALRWTARRIDRSPRWLSGIPRGGKWTAWCGGEISGPA